MIENIFETEDRPTLSLRVLVHEVQGRTDDMPANIWWSLPWSCVENFIKNPRLTGRLRDGFEWALANRPEEAA